MLASIFVQIIVPVFLLVAIGAVFSRSFRVDLPTINRLTFYVMAPAVVFIKIAESNLDPALLGAAAGFSLLHTALLMGLGWLVFRAPAFRERRPELVMGTIFYNCGNFGLPLAQLAFGDLGLNVMAIILAVQVGLNFTLGLWLASPSGGSRTDVLRSMLRVPLLYILALALLMNVFHITIPGFVRVPLEYLSDGLIPVALVALGVQLMRSNMAGSLRSLSTLVLSRLVLAPLSALALLALTAALLPGLYQRALAEITPILVVAAGLPVAVNAYILCAEYGRDAELVSQSIFWTTLLSAFTVAGWLAVV